MKCGEVAAHPVVQRAHYGVFPGVVNPQVPKGIVHYYQSFGVSKESHCFAIWAVVHAGFYPGGFTSGEGSFHHIETHPLKGSGLGQEQNGRKEDR